MSREGSGRRARYGSSASHQLSGFLIHARRCVGGEARSVLSAPPPSRASARCRSELPDPLCHQPLLVLGVDDLKFLNGPMDGFLLVGGANMPDMSGWAALDPGYSPLVQLL